MAAAAVLLCGEHTVRLKEDAVEIASPKSVRSYAIADIACTLEGGTLSLTFAGETLRLVVDSAHEAMAWMSRFTKQASVAQAKKQQQQQLQQQQQQQQQQLEATPRVNRTNTIIVKKKNKRQYLTLEDSVIKVYTHVDANGNPPKDSAKKISLSTIRAIKIYGNTMILEAFKTWELAVESPEEAQAWARLVECAMEEWTRRELEDVQRRISAQAAIDEMMAADDGGTQETCSHAPAPLPRELSRDLLETIAVSRALKLSSVMHAGFMLKLGGMRKNIWERRYFVLHISGVLNYYDQPWDPAKQMEPQGILILPQLLTVEWGEVVTGCSLWPADATPEQRLKLVFDRKTYFLCCHTEDDCERWKDAIMDVANLFEEEEHPDNGGLDNSGADGFEMIQSANVSTASLALTPAATLARATGTLVAGGSPGTQRRAAMKQRRSLFLHEEFQGESVVDDKEHEYSMADDRPSEYYLAAAGPSPTHPAPAATTATAVPATATTAAAASTAAPAPQESKLRLGRLSQAFKEPRSSATPAPAPAPAATAATAGRQAEPISSSVVAAAAALAPARVSPSAPSGAAAGPTVTSISSTTVTPTTATAAAATAPSKPAQPVSAAPVEEKLTTEQKAERERLQSDLPTGGAVARARQGFANGGGVKAGAPVRKPQVSLVEPERELPSASTTSTTSAAAGADDSKSPAGLKPGLGGAHARASRRKSIERSPTKQASPGRALGGKSVRRQPTKPELPSKVSTAAQLKPLEGQLNTARPATAKSAAFVEFLEAPDLPQLRSAFETVLLACGLTTTDANLYEKLKVELTPSLNFKQKSLFAVIDKRRRTLLAANESCADLQVIVSGGGPIGLRTALEMVLLEAQVTIVERREKYSRFNILHLWDWVYTDLVQLGANGADLLGKSFFHIGTRDLQLLLARIAILAGVQFMVGYETIDVAEPDETTEGLWRVQVRKLSDQSLVQVPANVVFVAGGANDGVAARLGFEPMVLGTSSAVGLVAHFTNSGTLAERSLDEISYARQYFPDLFGALDAKGLNLENIVYYQGNTHYYVMTPKREALLAYGVLKTDLPAPSDLARENVDNDKLRTFARTTAEFFRLPLGCPFVTEGAPVQLFDFSTRKASKTSCTIRSDADGNQLAVMLVGDAVLEPFWPEGLGINRGFHTAFDAIWVLQKHFALGHVDKPAAMIAAREELFTIIKSLSAFTKGNIAVENTKGYSLNPGSRYKAWRG